MKLKFLLLIFLVFPPPAFSAQDTYPFLYNKDNVRFKNLIQQIRCVVCQNQNIADSNAPLANDLRNKIYHMVLKNKSNADIKKYLTKRYGDFILLKPPLKLLTVFLWLTPTIGSLIIFLIFILSIKRARYNRGMNTL